MPRTSTVALAAALTTITPAAALAASGSDNPQPTSNPASPVRAPLAGHPSVAAHMRTAGDRLERHRALVRRNVGLAGDVAELRGRDPERGRASRVRTWSDERLRQSNRNLARQKRELREAAAAASATTSTTGSSSSYATAGASAPSGTLQAIAACESGGDPSAVGGGGAYRGKYQFSYSTWASVGGSGDPAAAPEAEQDARAAQLYAQQGSAPWPVCGG